jgi:dipeptidyl aminopeptidase/acylaminoacyl peptidase
LLPSEASLAMGSPEGDEQLLRDLLDTSSANPAVRFFYYIENPLPGSTTITEARFWRVDLQTGAQTLITTRPILGTFDTMAESQISPDGQWLAYQRRTGDNAGDLYVMRVDGSEEQLLARGVGTLGGGCVAYFAWSPDSTSIAVNRFDRASADPGWRLEVVDIAQPDAAVQIVAAPFLKFAGWVSQQKLLYITGSIPERIPYVEEVDITNQQRRTLYSFEQDTPMYCIRPSPNGTIAIINAGNGNWQLDLATSQIQPSSVYNTSLATWLPDGATMLLLQDDRPFLSRAATPMASAFIHLLPETPPDTSWSSVDASPDGQYLVACQYITQENRSRNAYLLLYTVASNTWSVIQAGCLSLSKAGWQ